MKLLMMALLMLASATAYSSAASHIISILDQIYGVELEQLTSLDDISQIESTVANLSQLQLDNLVSQLDAITGHSGYGELFNAEQDQKNQEWSPSTWANALMGEPGETQDRYNALLADYQENHPSMSAEEMLLGASDAYTDDYEQVVAVNQAANVQSTYEFNDINSHLENIQILTSKIEQADDEKSIADLNARINAEIAYLSVETIKMLTILNQQYAQDVASKLVDRQLASRMNQLPTE